MVVELAPERRRQFTGQVIAHEIGELATGHDRTTSPQILIVPVGYCKRASRSRDPNAGHETGFMQRWMPVEEAGFTSVAGETGARAGHPSGMHNLSKTQAVLSWALQLAAAGILLQTLFFKFTAAEESVYIFTTLGVEPWGRIGSGIVELLASVLLLVPATASLGALLALGVMGVAIVSHLTVLGIDVKGDGGLLFGLALVVFASCAVVFTLRRTQLLVVGQFLRWA